MSLAAPILRAVVEEGYTIPTPIQGASIPPIMDGRDMLGCAQTGTGKTAAFALPILHRLMAEPVDRARRGPALARVLVLAPTRELCTQIGDSFATYGRHTGLRHTCIYGGVSQFHQVRSLRDGVDIIVATPGRLEDLMQQRHVNLTNIRTFVLDEADRMLDMGFIEPIRRIAGAVPAQRQTLLFSATMPREIVRLAESLLRDPARVAVTPVASAAPKIEQSLYMVSRDMKQALLETLLQEGKIRRAVVFTRTKHGADRVAKSLARANISAAAIHGNKAQGQRRRALEGFRDGQARVLVATDVAARGLDVDGITHVFNFDIPVEAESYVHRIGRTARAGASGIAVSFCSGEERGLVRDIERLTGARLNITPTPALPDAPAREPHSSRPPHDHAQTEHRSPRHGHAQSRGHTAPEPSHGGRTAPRSTHRASTSKPGHAHARPSASHPAPRRRAQRWN